MSPRRWHGSALLASWLGLAAPLAATASPSPSFTVTDLGSLKDHGHPAYGTDAAGRSVVYSADGSSAYEFKPLGPTNGVYEGLPHMMQAPIYSQWTYGNPAYAYDLILDSAANGHGLTAFLEAVGVSGHSSDQHASIFVGRRAEDGSWHDIERIADSLIGSISGIPNGGGLSILGVDDRDQVLMRQSQYFLSQPPAIWLYDAKTKTTTDLGRILAPYGYSDTNSAELDADGRILVYDAAVHGELVGRVLLLTPSDLSAAPVPEPSTWMVLGLGGVAMAWRRLMAVSAA